MSVFQHEGEVSERRSVTPTGVLVVEFVWLPDGTSGNAVRELREPLEGRLVQFETSYFSGMGGSPGNYSVYLYCELGTDWLSGRGAALAPGIPHIRSLFETHGGTRAGRTVVMGLPTLFVDAGKDDTDRGTVRLLLERDGGF